MPEHATLITALLLDRHMCIDCLGVKASLSNGAVEGYLAIMARVLHVQWVRGECEICGVVKDVVTMERRM